MFSYVLAILILLCMWCAYCLAPTELCQPSAPFPSSYHGAPGNPFTCNCLGWLSSLIARTQGKFCLTDQINCSVEFLIIAGTIEVMVPYIIYQGNFPVVIMSENSKFTSCQRNG